MKERDNSDLDFEEFNLEDFKLKKKDNPDLDFEEFNLEDFNLEKKGKHFNLSRDVLEKEFEQSKKKESILFLIKSTIITASLTGLFYYVGEHNRAPYMDNNPNNSKGYYVFNGKDKTTIYDTFGYNGNQVDYTKIPGNIGASNIGVSKSNYNGRYYKPDEISKFDLLFQEQNSNKDGIVIFVDNYGVASFYENYQLVEKVDLVGKKVIDITGNSETIAENAENAYQYSKHKN